MGQGTTTFPHFSLDLFLSWARSRRTKPSAGGAGKAQGDISDPAGPGNKTFQGLIWGLETILSSPELGQERLRNLKLQVGAESFYWDIAVSCHSGAAQGALIRPNVV